MTDPAVKALADKYMLGTADKLPPRPKARPAPVAADGDGEIPPMAPFWTTAMREAFQQWAPVTLWVFGRHSPTVREIGDNSLIWPMKLGSSRSYKDTITKQARLWHWSKDVSVLCRVWVSTAAQRQQLAYHIVEALPHERLDNNFITPQVPDFDIPGIGDAVAEQDLGLRPLPPGSEPSVVRRRQFRLMRRKLEVFIHRVAADNGIEAWSDDALVRRLLAWESERMQRQVGAK